MRSISWQTELKHFPLQVPKDARNVELYKYSNCIRGGETILIKFVIDEEYINRELNKYSYVSVEKPREYNHYFGSLESSYDSNFTKDITFYVIEDSTSKKDMGKLYSRGIGVNKSKKQILYYYTNR